MKTCENDYFEHKAQQFHRNEHDEDDDDDMEKYIINFKYVRNDFPQKKIMKRGATFP